MLKVDLDGLAAHKTILQAELRKVQWEKKYDKLRHNVDIVRKNSILKKDINELDLFKKKAK